MINRTSNKLAWRLTKVAVLVALVIGIILNTIQIGIDYLNEEKKYNQIIDQIISASKPIATEVAFKLDKEGADELALGLLNYSFVTEVLITDEDDNLLAKKQHLNKTVSNTLWITKILSGEYDVKKTQLHKPGKPEVSYGVLALKINRDQVLQEFYSRSLYVFVSGLARNVFLSVVLLYFFYRLLTKPLLNISTAFSKINPEKIDGARLPLLPGHEENELGSIVKLANVFFENNETYLLKLKEAHQTIQTNSDHLTRILETTNEGFWFVDANRLVTDVNPPMCEILGLPRNGIIGRFVGDFVDDKNKVVFEEQFQIRSEGKKSIYKIEFLQTDGQNVPCSLSASPYFNNLGERTGSFAFVTNLSIIRKTEKEKEKLEHQLLQAQKMEAIGTLAGGIAHDFNNILAVILGYTEMARDDSQPGSTVAEDLDKVLEASNRAKSLVQQILAFSHQDDIECFILQSATIVEKAITMLRPSLPTTIEINQDIDAEAGFIFANPTQIHQIVVNIGTNAFHAMEETGGKLDISLKETELSAEDLTHETSIEAGTFVQLSICDSGPGIAPKIKNKLFEPYFTTKETGKGTGMGLSIVHGIVKSYGGFISLYSELGEGTAFHVFLPVVEKGVQPDDIKTVEHLPVGKERILFIDDEKILAEMGKNILERIGYHTTVRDSSLEALETFQNDPDQFDIVITDQTMPGMTGADLARRMLQIRPDIPIILCTGYSSIITEEKAKSIGIREFAMKPLTMKNIAVLIRKVLDNDQV